MGFILFVLAGSAWGTLNQTSKWGRHYDRLDQAEDLHHQSNTAWDARMDRADKELQRMKDYDARFTGDNHVHINSVMRNWF